MRATLSIGESRRCGWHEGVDVSEIYRGIQAERVASSTTPTSRGRRYVLYWMQQSQRAEFNHALEYAVHRANELDLPLLVAFGLMDDYPEANLRHYHFMVQGLADVARALRERKIPFVVQRGAPDEVALGWPPTPPWWSATGATCGRSGLARAGGRRGAVPGRPGRERRRRAGRAGLGQAGVRGPDDAAQDHPAPGALPRATCRRPGWRHHRGRASTGEDLADADALLDG